MLTGYDPEVVEYRRLRREPLQGLKVADKHECRFVIAMLARNYPLDADLAPPCLDRFADREEIVAFVQEKPVPVVGRGIAINAGQTE